jgi:TatD DNase family protein
MLVDTHAHLNFVAFDKDREKVIRDCLENDIWMINIGTNYETSKKAVEIAEKYPQGVYASFGLHPINLDTGLVKIKTDTEEGEHFEKEFDYEKYKNLGKSKKIVAIGEIGLDYYWKPKTTKKKELFKQKQKELFLKELKLAKDLNLPVIFHCRMAHQDLIEVLISNFQFSISKLKGVMHGFVGTLEQLKEYLKMGFYIGFNGIIFKKIEGINFEENIKKTPLDRILIETDCPYLAPPGFPAQREMSSRFDSPPLGVREERNNPLGVKFVAEKIAEIKKVSFDEVAKITTQNTKNLLKI